MDTYLALHGPAPKARRHGYALTTAVMYQSDDGIEQLQRDADRDYEVVKSLQEEFESTADRRFAFAFVGVPEEFWKPALRDPRYVPLIAECADDAYFLLGS